MSKAVLISIKPKWCELIASGKKTIEVRKTIPRLEVPFRCYIYETSGRKYENIGVYDPSALLYKDFLHHPQRVIGEFVCAEIERYARYHRFKEPLRYMRSNSDGYPADEIHYADLMISPSDLEKYGRGAPVFGWCISDLVIYDEPMELSKFAVKCPPQSWCYAEEL